MEKKRMNTGRDDLLTSFSSARARAHTLGRRSYVLMIIILLSRRERFTNGDCRIQSSYRARDASRFVRFQLILLSQALLPRPEPLHHERRKNNKPRPILRSINDVLILSPRAIRRTCISVTLSLSPGNLIFSLSCIWRYTRAIIVLKVAFVNG